MQSMRSACSFTFMWVQLRNNHGFKPVLLLQNAVTLTLWPLYHFFSKWLSNTLCIYICTVQKRLSAHYAYIYAHFSLFDVFTVALQAPGQAWNRVVHCQLHMEFWQGGVWLWRSSLQHLPVRFTCSKLPLVGEVSPFDSEFTAGGSLTRMRSGTLSQSAEGDFFRQFWQGGARLQRSPPQHLPVQFTRGKLRLVGEVCPFDSEFTVRGSLTQMRSGTPSKLAEGNFFRGVIVHFLKNTCLRTMECLHCELKAFSDCAYIYA